MIYLIHWTRKESENRAKELRDLGYRVSSDAFDRDSLLRMRKDPPRAVVIDLSRAPSQGRDVALAIRISKPLRRVPLVFVEGDPEKVARIKDILPDAVYTDWKNIRESLKMALSHPPLKPVVPRTVFDPYSGTPLTKKLGIKAGSIVALIEAPEDFRQTLGHLPENVVLHKSAKGQADLTIWFIRSRRTLERRIGRMKNQAEKGGLWIAWPKKASGVATDLSQSVVRKVGLASGLVDFKVCSIDAVWTGLRFSLRH
jgi:hypothetical protein